MRGAKVKIIFDSGGDDSELLKINPRTQTIRVITWLIIVYEINEIDTTLKLFWKEPV